MGMLLSPGGKTFDQPDNARRSGKLEIKVKAAKVVTPRGPLRKKM